MPVIRVYTGPSTYKELDLDDYYVKNTDFIDALRTPTVYMRNLRLYLNGVPTAEVDNLSIAEMMIPERFNNKLAFYDISKIKFYTSNNKTTWTEFVVSDDNKRKLVGGDITSTAPLIIPAGTPHFRIEIEATLPYHCFLNALYSYWSSQGNYIKVKIQKRNCSTLAWEQHTDSDVYVGEWPGHLFLPFESIRFHPNSTSSSDYNAIRIDFVDIDWIYPEREIRFHCLQIWGGLPAGKRTIYSVDEYKRTTFPAEVKATTFKRSSDNVEVSYKDHKHSASEITSGTLSSDRLPSIPFDLLPVGTSSSTVARGSHNHFLSGLSDVAFTPLSGGQMMIYSPEAGGKWVNFTPDFALRSHTHSAGDINSGTLDSARIPNLSASKITSGTLSSDRLPSIPFDLLPVGTSSNTVARGTHTHGIDDVIDYVERGLQLLRSKPSALTSVGSGTSSGSVTLNSTLSSGTPIFIEVNTTSSYTAVPKIIGVTVGGTTTRASATGEEYIAGWSTFDGTDFHIYTFSVWYSDDTLYFGAKRYIRGNFTSSAINWTTSTYTLYVGRVWGLPLN